MRFAHFIMIFVATTCLQYASYAHAGENCTCRYDGKDIVEGQSVCMRTANGMQMAKCDRVLNNTAWKFTGTPCPYADLNPPTGSVTEKNFSPNSG